MGDGKDIKKLIAEQVAETARIALKNLVSKGNLPWPDVYAEEFWQVAKSQNLSLVIGHRPALDEGAVKMLQEFVYDTENILEGVKDTVEDFMQVTKEQVSDMKSFLKSLDQKDKENIFYEDIAKLLVINKTLEAKTKETEEKIKEQAKIIDDLRNRLRIDPLTNLLNRRALESDLKKEIAKIRRYNYPLSLIMFDIDHFKKINDTYGHQTGDKILQNLADIWKDLIRDSDSIYRYGGEEFLIMAPHTVKKEAYLLAERLRKKVKHYKFVVKPPDDYIQLTLSLGVTQVDPEKDMEEALDKVDKALYMAKNQGRDQTVVL